MITIKLFGALKSIAKEETITLPLPELENTNIMNVINVLGEKFNPELRHAIIGRETGDPRAQVLILKNGKEISALDGLSTQVMDGDNIAILPVIHGG
ncbi:MAG: MoaD/ThiS family protein [Candidatus Bathyarchaeota archaeon]